MIRDRGKLVLNTTLDGENAGAFYYSTGVAVFDAQRRLQVVGIYDSLPVDGSSALLGWHQLHWSATVPENTKLYFYVRSAPTINSLQNTSWTGPFLNQAGESIVSQTSRYLQVRMALSANIWDGIVTPTIQDFSVDCFQKGERDKFYTKTFSLGFMPKYAVLTYNGTISPDTILQFAIAGVESTSDADYIVVKPNTLQSLEDLPNLGGNLKIMLSGIGPANIPFVVDDFGLIVAGDGQTYINAELTSSSSSSSP